MPKASQFNKPFVSCSVLSAAGRDAGTDIPEMPVCAHHYHIVANTTRNPGIVVTRRRTSSPAEYLTTNVAESAHWVCTISRIEALR